jgi:O-antigen/teichoic acid export membrane protein
MEDERKGGSITATTSLTEKPRAHESALRGPDASEFKRKSVQGGVLTVLSQSFAMVLQIGTTVILARLLAPSDYGLQSMVFTLTTFLALFKDAGLSVASIQREELTTEQISTLFWINVAVGIFLTLVVAAAAPILAAFYKEPRLLWITVASAPIFFFNSLVIQHGALLSRAMRFGTTVKIEMLAATAGAIVAIVMAVKGFGYWALICQNICVPFLCVIAVWIAMPWVPGKPHWTPELRSMLRFGGTVTLNGVVVYIAYNTEKILLGRYWGAASLGVYTRGYQLATLPVQQLINAVHVVAFSVLSRMQGEAKRLERAYLKSLSIIVALTVPVVICSALFAKEIVLIVLGPKWLGAVPVLRFLAPTVLFFALINPFSWFLRATGRVRRSLNTAFLICPVVVLGVIAGLHHGPAGVALGYSAAMVLLFVPIVIWAKHGTGITSRNYWDVVKQPLISGVIAGAAGWLVHMVYGDTLSPIPLLSIELAMSAVVYFGWMLFVMGQKDFYFDLVKTIVQRRQADPAESVT